ncbi:MAG: Ig-like domain-containing protein, partial [Deltaproteobacteria bacterium]|nr:Ig-like domain-containing protein [Deltaproteobacteria bacterium]
GMNKANVYLLLIFAMFLFSACSCGDDTATAENDAITGDILQKDISNDVVMSDVSLPDGVLPDGILPDGVLPDEMSDTEIIPFEVFSVSPEAGYRGADVNFIISGTGFLTGARVFFVNEEEDPVYEEEATVNEILSDSIKGVFVANLNRPLGLYDVKVVNGDSATKVLKKAFRVLINPPPRITDIEPKTGFNGDPLDGKNSDVMLTIYGENFVSTPAVRFISRNDSNLYFISPSVSFHSDKNITAIVPTESYKMPSGDYIVEVINPDKQSGFFEKFTVTTTPAPLITSVNPYRMPSNTGADPFVVIGENFADGAKLYAVSANAEIELAIKKIAPNQIDAVIAPNQLGLGYYPIKVVNPDGQYDYYYAIQIMSSAEGKLTQWAIVGSKLKEGRFRHASVFFRDQFKNPYILVAGGNNLVETLDSVEIAPVALSGELGEFNKAIQFNPETKKRDFVRLTTKRQNFGLIRIRDRIIALGGFDGTTALDTIEIAKVNTKSDSPKPLRPSFTTLSGSLPLGSWYYKISAVYSDGESLPSREIILPNVSGTNILRWTPKPGALYYNIYRSPSADGIAGSERLIATGVNGTVFNDDGEGILVPAPSRVNAVAKKSNDATLPAGIYKYVVTAVTANFESTQSYEAVAEIKDENNSVSISWEKIKSAFSYNVYRTEVNNKEFYLLKSGIRQNNYLDTGIDPLDKNKRPPEIIKPLERGSIRYFVKAKATLKEKREGLRAIYVRNKAGEDIVFAIGGRSDSANYLKTVERGIFSPDSNDFTGFEYDKSVNINRAFFGIAGNFVSDENDFPNEESDEPPITPYCEDVNTSVAFIEIAPIYKVVNPGAKVQYEAIARDITGCIIRNLEVSWNSSDTQVATINNLGLASALKAGTTYITATHKGITSNKATLIVQNEPVSDVFTIVVKPEYTTREVGQQQQYTAEAFDRQGNKLNIAAFNWRSDNPSVATINNNGLATALSRGKTGITAEYQGVLSNVAILEVTGGTACEVARIEIEPVLAGILVGQSVQYTVKAYNASGNPVQHSSFGYVSTDTTIASIDNKGKATGLSVGTTTIFATACGVLSNKAILNVSSNNECKFAKIVISPPDATIEIMQKQTYTAVSYDSCGNVIERNDYVYKSSDTNVAVMNGNVATGIGLGVTYITAEAGGIVSNQARLTVIKQRLQNEPIFVYLVGGDDSFTSGNNSGIKSIEYSQIDENGYIVSWNVATEDITKPVLGVEAQVYAGFLFVFGGIQSESGGSYNASNTVERFPVSPQNGSVGKKENTGAQMQNGRGYFSIIRIPPFMYAIGGVSGNTLVSTIERIPQ